MIRNAIRAGTFYEASPQNCRSHVKSLIRDTHVAGPAANKLASASIVGGIVPHAGWAFSGRLAAMTIQTIAAANPNVQTFVLMGADHYGVAEVGEIFESGQWHTPLGEISVDNSLAGELLETGGPFRINPHAHAQEHSIEVQLPIIQTIVPSAMIMPISVPPTLVAVEIGQIVGQVAAKRAKGQVMILASTDLTHIGGHFGPAPDGGESENFAAKNDRRIIDLIETMKPAEVLAEADRHRNACGAGAIAAAIAACKELGATKSLLLEYTNSYRVIRQIAPKDGDDTTVGYASMVFV